MLHTIEKVEVIPVPDRIGHDIVMYLEDGSTVVQYVENPEKAKQLFVLLSNLTS